MEDDVEFQNIALRWFCAPIYEAAIKSDRFFWGVTRPPSFLGQFSPKATPHLIINPGRPDRQCPEASSNRASDAAAATEEISTAADQ